ncbi:MAG: 2-C-methyl-D-erythritol 4-phosphate cytidylyltransferase [Thiotrichales bacterium]|nr:2-C-methyl-D-erythritol 4-phosphate cytidylyltransferase [Thiotrichales bacterium]
MSSAKNWVVIPAAGIGTRMQAEMPKQYMKLRDKTVLEHAAERFLQHSAIEGIVVVVNASDPYWPGNPLSGNQRIMTTTGGNERCHSVLNGLELLTAHADENDWVLVHDAARPCLCNAELDRLLAEIADHADGGLLALPVRDTMKRCNKDNEITGTVERDGLWHALTPQMFRLGPLLLALKESIDRSEIVTDEAQAMEKTGVKPLLVRGEVSNIKITRTGDLELAEFYLNSRG